MQSFEMQIIEMRRREYQRHAEQYRLRRMAVAGRPGTVVRFMNWTGRRLVAAGESLQVRAVAPVVASDPCI